MIIKVVLLDAAVNTGFSEDTVYIVTLSLQVSLLICISERCVGIFVAESVGVTMRE
jgi:hypothetical protein